MGMISRDLALTKLQLAGADVEHLRLTQDEQIIVYRSKHDAHAGPIRRIPALFVIMCVSGGGAVSKTSDLQDIDADFGPGDIAVMPPNSKGRGEWPEATLITLGISVSCVAEAFGEQWPEKLKRNTFSRVFRDPLVEATMSDIGYARADSISDKTLLHAAHMIVHQLLDSPFDHEQSSEVASPLHAKTVSKLQEFLDKNLESHVTVEEMAESVNMSRFHFSRRFKAATGQSPHQFALLRKLDHAAKILDEEDDASVMSIAHRLGYSNPAQFSSVFKRRFGLPPRLWRSRTGK